MSAVCADTVLACLRTRGLRVLSLWWVMYALRGRYSQKRLQIEAQRTLRYLLAHDLVCPIEGTAGTLVLVREPAPEQEALDPLEVISEAYFEGLLAYETAFDFHGLSDSSSTTVHILMPNRRQPDYAVDRTFAFADVAWAPRPHAMSSFGGLEIVVHETRPEWVFGHSYGAVAHGHPRYTSLERSLIDGLRFARHCGGIDMVLRGWALSSRLYLDLDDVVSFTERLESGILCQRVGFVLETLGHTHPRLAHWKATHAQRGGSRRLDPERPYDSAGFDETWKLSVNCPITPLLAAP